MIEETKNLEGRPETPTLDTGKKEATGGVAESIGKELSGEETKKEETTGDAPIAKTPNMVDMNNLSVAQVQDLQELFATTPRRKNDKEKYHTIELRIIDGKYITEWGTTFFALRNDTVQRKDVMKTIIPVRFYGEKDFVDLLWKDQFMNADKKTCKILNMNKEEVPRHVGECNKRDDDGGLTSQIVEQYVNEVVITLTVALPTGEEISINGKFAN